MNENKVKTPEQCKSASVQIMLKTDLGGGGGVYINVLSCTVHAGLLLEHLLPTLFLRREASDGPDFDLDAVVELLSSHIPHTLVGSRNGPILFPGRKRGFRNLTLEALHAFMHLTHFYLKWIILPANAVVWDRLVYAFEGILFSSSRLHLCD